MPTLFDPLKIGDLDVPNRIFLAPLTRNRSTGPGRVPNAMMREYYMQRASAGLIISEATSVAPAGVGYPHTPGVWSDEQVEGWRNVVAGVHGAGGRIFLQLWHVGRISDPIYHDGALPVAPERARAQRACEPGSPAARLTSRRARSRPRKFADVIEAFRRGAENAKAAGFDGVEVHGANGYLLDQFLQDSANKRDDVYGGSIENRARLLLEVTDAVVSVWGAGRVGVHFAPRADMHDMGDSDLSATFGYAARELGKRRIAFLCSRESTKAPRIGPDLKAAFGGVYIANEGFATRGRPRRRSKPAKPTRWRSANSSSPTPTCRGASRSARRSTPGTPRPSIATARPAIPTIRRSRKRRRPSRERRAPSAYGFRCSISMKA